MCDFKQGWVVHFSGPLTDEILQWVTSLFMYDRCPKVIPITDIRVSNESDELLTKVSDRIFFFFFFLSPYFIFYIHPIFNPISFSRLPLPRTPSIFPFLYFITPAQNQNRLFASPLTRISKKGRKVKKSLWKSQNQRVNQNFYFFHLVVKGR